MLDGLECAEAGLGAVPGEEDDLHGSGFGEGEVEPEEASDEGEGGPRGEGVAPVFDLVGAVGLHAAVAEDAVRGGHVEEGAGGDGDRELGVYGVGHGLWVWGWDWVGPWGLRPRVGVWVSGWEGRAMARSQRGGVSGSWATRATAAGPLRAMARRSARMRSRSAGGRADIQKSHYLYGLLGGGVWGQIDPFTQRWWRFGDVGRFIYCAVRNANPFPI